jgi:drug/metabolite transporter (DMT)-like permease
VHAPARKDHIDLVAAVTLVGFNALLGLNQALVKLVNGAFSPIFQSGLRSACAFFVVLAWAIAARRRLSIRDGSLPYGLFAGFLFALEFALLFYAVEFTSVARASVLFYSMPFMTALAAHFLFREDRLTTARVVGLVLAICGIALVLGDTRSQPGEQAWIGDLLALAAAMAWSGVALFTRGTRLVESSQEQEMLYHLSVSALILVPLAFVIGAPVRDPNGELLAIFAFQVVAVASAGFLAWSWVLRVYPVSRMVSFSLLAPVAGVFFGWLVFSDPLSWRFAGAFAAVAIGLVVINRR